MKKLILLLLCLSLFACKRNDFDQDYSTEKAATAYPTPINDEAQVMATLMTMSYVGKKHPDYIFDSLNIALNDKSYITKGEWGLAWYNFNTKKSLLAFIAYNKQQPGTYALCIRGTNFASVYNFFYDIDIYRQADWIFGKSLPDSKIINGSMIAFNAILDTKGQEFYPNTGDISLTDYIKQIFNEKQNPQGVQRFYVTGHSLGGGLAALFADYILEDVVNIENNYNKSLYSGIYTFASPAIGNEEFAQSFENLLDRHRTPAPGKTQINFKRYYVTNDVIPYLYHNISELENVDYPLTTFMKLQLRAFAKTVTIPLKAEDMVFEHLGNGNKGEVISLNIKDLPYKPDLPEEVNVVGDFTKYGDWSHSHNNYSILIGGSYVPKR
ncbi:MAG: hypothetical protein ACEPOW_05675 [Bacteroidales bacterium]